MAHRPKEQLNELAWILTPQLAELTHFTSKFFKLEEYLENHWGT